ncbi:hypothetical protein P9D34_13395 [Bacillus swezeyi]|uniref:Uncharacterized protein n=1 Tax=Bacillus swezeyi TaxID=1925020 RepID=A0A1R1QPS5_9BACI|nr:hypothetical protein [Bacillus swezeyi]MEC1261427.1 hypothetical protein [Bacillus swezeyi]MED2926710.1 hypothetical protein [Bacillus swezeyi]MED2944183.1 hypothetical protein [Bacillus swezeyi]MED2965728.1 hypothetical protein [Bacillus swezeyi]MED2976597.1 hypothetical protein [Bacillus swezeyi]
MSGYSLSVYTNPGIVDGNYGPHVGFFYPNYDFPQHIDFYTPHTDNLDLNDSDVAYARLKSIFNLVRGVFSILNYPKVWEDGKLNYDHGTHWSKPTWRKHPLFSHIEKQNPFDDEISLKLTNKEQSKGRFATFFQLVVDHSHIRDVMNLYVDAIDNNELMYINAYKIYETIKTDLGISGRKQEEQLNSLDIPLNLKRNMNKIKSSTKLLNNDGGIFYKRHGHNPFNPENPKSEEELNQLNHIKDHMKELVYEWFKYNIEKKERSK